MNRRDSILPDSIAIFENIAAFDLAAKAWIDDIKIEELLVYNVDRVNSKALPLLAAQFDVLGKKGWNLCQTDTERRALIKRAIELHRYKGTPWAIKQALKSIGFQNVVIEEHTSGHWARFKVYLDNNQVTLTTSLFASVMDMINEYKNARSLLDGVFITIAVDDEVEITDEASINEQLRSDDTAIMTAALVYDGSGDHDGTYNYAGDSDTAIIS